MGQKVFPKQKNLKKKKLAVVFTTMIFSNFRKTRIESYRIVSDILQKYRKRNSE